MQEAFKEVVSLMLGLLHSLFFRSVRKPWSVMLAEGPVQDALLHTRASRKVAVIDPTVSGQFRR
jgi:hypothetical protein